MTKILITGGAGFIGSHLTRRLVNDGHEVLVFDKKLPEIAQMKLGDIWGDFGYLHSSDYATITDSAWNGVDTVFHLAAERSVPRGEKFPELFIAENVLKMQQLLARALNRKVRRLVFSSSSSVYGGKGIDGVQHEGIAPCPDSVYAQTKLSGEEFCAFYARRGLQTVALRLFNVIGPGQDLDDAYAVVVPKFITEALYGRPIPVQWDGQQTRDFTYVDNVVEASLVAMNAGRGVSGRAFNVASGTSHSVLYLAEEVKRLTGSSSPIKISGDKRAGDVRGTRGDPTQARFNLGYTAPISFEEGLARTVQWAMERYQRGEKPF